MPRLQQTPRRRSKVGICFRLAVFRQPGRIFTRHADAPLERVVLANDRAIG